MSWWQAQHYLRLLCILAWLTISSMALASEHHGQVTFSGLPVPGATVTVTQGTRKSVTVTDQQGIYSFPDLPDGTATIEVEMLCFANIKQEVAIAPNAPAAQWELKLLSLDQMRAAIKLVPNTIIAAPAIKSEAEKSQTQKPPEPEMPQPDQSQRPSDGLLINGSVNNAAVSPFSQAAAFGNRRNGVNGLYTGGIGTILSNSALNARPFSLSGLDIPQTAYNQVTVVATLGGPLRIPHLLPHGPNFFLAYQWTRSLTDATQAALVPDSAERSGDLSNVLNPSGQPIAIIDPTTGLPFPGNVTPISPQAIALLKLYPSPNLAGNSRYNYQAPIISNSHQDALQSRLDKTIGRRDQIFGTFAFQSTRSSSSNLFGFLDTTDVFGINTNVNWSHRLNHQLFLTVGYRFSRLRTQVNPFFANREDVSGIAGITGNSQAPADWGPPSLNFSSGIASLSDDQSSSNRNETNGVSSSLSWSHSHHYVTLGGDFRRQEFSYLAQEDPRGTFFFTGAATAGTANGVATSGSDFADFLLGVPDTSSIAFGNADKYLRQSVYDAYITDDWRINPELTLNVGARWEYGAPITELHDRLVNLDVAAGFAAVAPVLASDPVGLLTGQRYPTSLIRPDKRDVEPRIGLSWRPLPGSSVVVRAGYGIYADTSVYQATALQLAQQSPLSKSLSVPNSSACPLTLANGFNPCSSITPNTFSVDPNFRVGYAQTWQLAVQSDLPQSLQLTATYLGIKGTRGVQEFLPNTSPIGASNPCPGCLAGFTYRTSNGNSTRESGQLQLRRRLRSGFTASLLYTFSKSIDDDSVLGGQGPVASTGSTQSTAPPAAAVIAQNWLDLNAERGLSTFDQRHLLNAQLQYTTGVGIGGMTLLNGWRGTLFKDWTVLTNIAVGSGLPQTPIYLAAVPGTGVTGTIRPHYTGAPISAAPPGLFLNPAAYTAPLTGQWGDAGRNSITGPDQFSLNASLARTFRLRTRFNLDLRVDSTNLLNHVVYTSWNTIINSTQFGLPAAANPMRSIQTTLRLRF